jgi:hypothetical protein
MASPTFSPSLNIPSSNSTVDVSIIDSTTSVNGLPVSAFMAPQIPGEQVISNGVSYAFLVKCKSTDKPSQFDTLIFDLGTRKDFENGPKVVVEQAKENGFSMSVEKDIETTLEEHGEDINHVGGIVWSYYHVVSPTHVLSLCDVLIVGRTIQETPRSSPKRQHLSWAQDSRKLLSQAGQPMSTGRWTRML